MYKNLDVGFPIRFYFKKKKKKKKFLKWMEAVILEKTEEKLKVVGIFYNKPRIIYLPIENCEKVLIIKDYNLIFPDEIIENITVNENFKQINFYKQKREKPMKKYKIKDVVERIKEKIKIRYYFPNPINRAFVDVVVYKIYTKCFRVYFLDDVRNCFTIFFDKYDSEISFLGIVEKLEKQDLKDTLTNLIKNGNSDIRKTSVFESVNSMNLKNKGLKIKKVVFDDEQKTDEMIDQFSKENVSEAINKIKKMKQEN